jgi:hypothetical protein
MKSFTPTCGTMINQACLFALGAAKSSNSAVKFVFNGVRMHVRPNDTLDQLLRRWSNRIGDHKEKYERKHKARIAREKEERANEIVNRQQSVDQLIDELPALLSAGDRTAIMGWVRQFTDTADDVGVNFDKQAVIKIFEDAGFEKNAFTGEDFRAEAEASFRYIVGQVINCLYDGMPPHPVAICFCDRWLRGDYGLSPSSD